MTSEICKSTDEANIPSPLRIIGQGFCGTVWASGSGPAFKREDGGPFRSLRNDFEMHRRCVQSVRKLPTTQIQIPVYDKFISAEDRIWWRENYQIFPPGYQARCNLIQSQRIPPFSERTRQRLIAKFCPPSLVSKISTSLPDKDCLVRPYIGRRRMQNFNKRSGFTPFSLRNFPLHVDQMELLLEIRDHIPRYVKLMAEALAMMHWVAGIDGNDIEFVLAPPRDDNSLDSTIPPTPVDLETDSYIEAHSLWILDFDLCKEMAMDSKGMKQAAIAFWRNDPYYPRPGRSLEKDKSLWTVFREHYIQTSENYIDVMVDEPTEAERRRGLSKQFISLVETGMLCKEVKSIFNH